MEAIAMWSKSVCIVGATGFVGRHLVNALKIRSDIKIKLLTRNVSQVDMKTDKMEIIEGDLLDINSLRNFIESGAIVINLAYLNTKNPETNFIAIQNLAAICRQKNISHLIHLSTAIVAGATQENPVLAETRCFPTNTYEMIKLSIENLLKTELVNACRLTILRPTAIFGVGGKNLNKIIQELRERPSWLNKLRLSLYSGRKMNLVSVENVIAAILFLIECGSDNTTQCYIISDDDESLNNYTDISAMILEHFNLPKIKPLPIPFTAALLSLLLRVKNGSPTNVYRVYSSETLLKLGFKKPLLFKQAIEKYLSGF